MPITRVESHSRKTDPTKSITVSFNKLEEIGVCVVLTKAIEKLKIIQHQLPEAKGQEYEHYQPMATRMTTLPKVKPPEDQEEGSTEALGHIQKCCQLSQSAMEKVMQGFKGNESSLLGLKQIIVLSEYRRYYDNLALKQENLNLNNTIHNLNEKINEVKMSSQETSLYLDKITQFCLQQIQTTTWAQAKTLKKNSEEFNRAWKFQNNYKWKEKENNFTSTIEECTSETLREDIINTEIKNHLEMVTSNLQKKLEKWTVRYSEEVDVLDIALLQLRSRAEEQQEKLALMSEKYAAKQVIVGVLQEEADQRDRDQVKRVIRTKAAVIIQAWWRNILFFKHMSITAKKARTKKSKNEPLKKSKKEPSKKKKK